MKKGKQSEAGGWDMCVKWRKWSVGCGRYQLIVPSLQHDVGKISHDGVGLDVKVTERRIRVPAVLIE